MKIAKVFNNNIAVAVNDFGQDVVIMGRGVAFQKRFGDDVDPAKIEREFHENADDLTRRYRDLVLQVPEEFFEVAARIIDTALMRLGHGLDESVYFALADHIHFAVQRMRQGIAIRNELLLETSVVYPDEFAIGREALPLIDAAFGVSMPDDEAAFIALHLVEASEATSMSNAVAMTRIVAVALDTITDFLGQELPVGSLDAYRLNMHLKLFARRVCMGERDTIGLADAVLERSVKRDYPDSYRCAVRVIRAVRRECELPIPREERVYLTVHIERIRRGLAGEEEASG